MTFYDTEQEYMDAFENGQLVPEAMFFVRETRTLGFAVSASDRILFATFEQPAQFSYAVITGDLVVHGNIQN